MKSLFFLTLLAPLAAHADDTYNFYFQKAPGPVTVNQGTASASPTAPAATSVAPSAAAVEESAPPRRWELSLGFGGLRAGPLSVEGLWYNMLTRTNAVYGNQYSLGLEYNFNENFGFQGEVFHLTSTPVHVRADTSVAASGSLFDYGASLVITPFRLRMGGSLRLAFSGLIGFATVPMEAGEASDFVDPNPPWRLGHAGSLTYGARVALEAGDKFALQATYRKLDKFSSNQAAAALAIKL